jgi:hypothetical protein
MRVRLPAVITLVLAVCGIAQSTHLAGNARATSSTIAIAPQKSDASVRLNRKLLRAQSGIARSRSVRSLPIAVDGKKTPELIPDWLAYQQLIMVSATPTPASAEQIRVSEARLNAVGFSQQDHDAYIAALVNVREELEQVAADQRMWMVDTPTARAMHKVLRDRRDQILEDARIRLQTSFTPDGRSRLNSFVQNQKRRITVYGSLPQLQAAAR